MGRRGRGALVAELRAARERVRALELQVGAVAGRAIGLVAFRGKGLCGVCVRESGGWWQVQEVTPLGEVLFVGARRSVKEARVFLDGLGADKVVRLRR